MNPDNNLTRDTLLYRILDKDSGWIGDVMAQYGALIAMGEIELGNDLLELHQDDDYYRRQVGEITEMWQPNPHVDWYHSDETTARRKSIEARLQSVIASLDPEIIW